MELLYFRETPDDGDISIYKIKSLFNYNKILSESENKLFSCNGYSKNNRKSGVFTLDKNKINQPLSNKWKIVPERYKYQPFIPILDSLLKEIINLKFLKSPDLITDAFINLYGKNDFIAFHKDEHDFDNKNPIAVILSFEKYSNNCHVMQFYRTLGNLDATCKKDKSNNKEEFDVILPNSSLAIMNGMQNKYVHSVKPGEERISIVFTKR